MSVLKGVCKLKLLSQVSNTRKKKKKSERKCLSVFTLDVIAIVPTRLYQLLDRPLSKYEGRSFPFTRPFDLKEQRQDLEVTVRFRALSRRRDPEFRSYTRPREVSRVSH